LFLVGNVTTWPAVSCSFSCAGCLALIILVAVVLAGIGVLADAAAAQ
jgi:hypothetical protein